MQNFTLDRLWEELRSDKAHPIILDTDAYNEVDDQFCIAYCMRSPERIKLLSINAAPFLNRKASSPAEGMEKSYQEIFHIMQLTDPNASIPVYRGSTSFLPDRNTPVESDAADNIIRTVMNSEEPVLIIAIGAITNVASALLKCPELAQRTAVLWLGGHALHVCNRTEFNMVQDIPAAQVLFDSGIPLLQIPCNGVCTEFVTSVPELRYYLGGKNALCDYLIENVAQESRFDTNYAVSRILWDVTAAAPLIVPKGASIVQIPRPRLTDDGYYATDSSRPHYLYVNALKRDRIFADLFRALTGTKN